MSVLQKRKRRWGESAWGSGWWMIYLLTLSHFPSYLKIYDELPIWRGTVCQRRCIRTSFSAVFRAAGALLACFDLQGRLSQETPVNQLCTTDETQLSVCWASLEKKPPSQSRLGGAHTEISADASVFDPLPFSCHVLILCTSQPSCTDIFSPLGVHWYFHSGQQPHSEPRLWTLPVIVHLHI